MKTDQKAMRFGKVAVEKGFVEPSQVIEALQIQFREDLNVGEHRLIGQILLGEGHITSSQLHVVLAELGKEPPREPD